MDLTEQLQIHFLRYNNRPLDDFCGLSLVQMQQLLYYPYSEGSPVRIKKKLSFDTIDQLGLFRVTEDLLHIVHREKEIKLTATGALMKSNLICIYRIFLERLKRKLAD